MTIRFAKDYYKITKGEEFKVSCAVNARGRNTRDFCLTNPNKTVLISMDSPLWLYFFNEMVRPERKMGILNEDYVIAKTIVEKV